MRVFDANDVLVTIAAEVEDDDPRGHSEPDEDDCSFETSVRGGALGPGSKGEIVVRARREGSK